VKKTYTKFPLDRPDPAFKNDTSVWVPTINVRLGWHHKETPRFHAIVDSGSQCCLFRTDLAEYLGIDVKKGIESTMHGLSQAMSEPVYYHKVKLNIESNWVIEIPVGFIKKLSVAGIVGRRGFFDNFRVRFDQSAMPPFIELERIERIQ
jgi:hypothetical protein